MQIFVLDSSFEKIDLVEGFTSFIWTERWQDHGDFELKLPYGHVHARRLNLRNYIYIEESRTLMVIESLERNSHDAPGDLVTVKGRSISSFLIGKIHTGLTTTNYPSRIVTSMVNQAVATGERAPHERDVIPNLPVMAYTTFGEEIHYETGPTPVFDAIQRLAKEHVFGFSLDFQISDGGFRFRIIQGQDRQDELNFNPTVGNLTNISSLRSIEDFYNIAYVSHPALDYLVTVNRLGYSIGRGVTRKAILVDGGSVDPTYEKLLRLGQEALSEHRNLSLIDGDYRTLHLKYTRDYNLGDLVRVADDIGNLDTARITEHIWVYDHDGFRAYPTFQKFDEL